MQPNFEWLLLRYLSLLVFYFMASSVLYSVRTQYMHYFQAIQTFPRSDWSVRLTGSEQFVVGHAHRKQPPPPWTRVWLAWGGGRGAGTIPPRGVIGAHWAFRSRPASQWEARLGDCRHVFNCLSTWNSFIGIWVKLFTKKCVQYSHCNVTQSYLSVD